MNGSARRFPRRIRRRGGLSQRGTSTPCRTFRNSTTRRPASGWRTVFSAPAKRTWDLEQGVEIQHELLPRVSVTASYYRGTFYDLLVYDNRSIGLADWKPIQVFNPIDGTPMTIYDINAAAKTRPLDNFDTTSS